MKKLFIILLILLCMTGTARAETNLKYDIYTNSNIWKLYSSGTYDVGNFTKIVIPQNQPIIEMNKVNGLELKYDGSSITGISNNIRFIQNNITSNTYHNVIDFKTSNNYVSNITLDMPTKHVDDSYTYPVIMHIINNELYTFKNQPISLNNNGSGRYAIVISIDNYTRYITLKIYKDNNLISISRSTFLNDIKNYELRLRINQLNPVTSVNMHILDAACFTQNDMIDNRFIDINNQLFYNFNIQPITGINVTYTANEVTNIEFIEFMPGSHPININDSNKVLFWDMNSLKPIVKLK